MDNLTSLAARKRAAELIERGITASLNEDERDGNAVRGILFGTLFTVAIMLPVMVALTLLA